MKTIMTTKDNIIRVSDERALELLKEGFKYIPKSEWKEKVRDVDKTPALTEDTGKLELTKEKNNKMSRSTKRHLRKANK